MLIENYFIEATKLKNHLIYHRTVKCYVIQLLKPIQSIKIILSYIGVYIEKAFITFKLKLLFLLNSEKTNNLVKLFMQIN